MNDPHDNMISRDTTNPNNEDEYSKSVITKAKTLRKSYDIAKNN